MFRMRLLHKLKSILYTMLANSPAVTKPVMVDMIINNQPVSMELDTGSAFTLVSEHTFRSKWQIEESCKYAVVNTHRGLFRYNRLPFGVSSVREYFSVSWKTF